MAVLSPYGAILNDGVNVIRIFERPPTVTGIAPNSGPAAGGTAVTITGTQMTGVTGVTFGGVAATAVVVVNDTTVTAVTPAHAIGAVDVVTTDADGSFTSVAGFTYTA